MRALKVKTNNSDAGIIVLCQCGNLLYLDPEELGFDKKLLTCEKCKNEIVVTKDAE